MQPIESSGETSASTTFGTDVKTQIALGLRLECEAPAEPYALDRADGSAGASPSSSKQPVALFLVLLAISLLSLQLRAQNAPTSAPAAAGQGWVAPEKSVQLQLKRPWTPRPDVAGSNVQLYGGDLTVPSPVFTVAEANKRCSWLYQLAVPIDVEKYPIAVMRYRAKNINPKSVYTLRVDCGVENPPGVCRLFPGNELESDGEIHEVKRDLRDFHVTDAIALVGIGVQSGTDLPATLEVIDIRFDAPDDAPVESAGDDNGIAINVTDENDKPIRGARVMVDLERRNFVRNGTTDDSGNVTITPRKNESDTHMVAVSAPGYTQVEVVKITADEPVKVKLKPAKAYGGVAKVDGKAVAGAMVLATLKGDATEGQQELRSYSTITDSEGRWITPPLPANVEELELSMSHSDGASIAKVDLNATEAQAAAGDVAKEIAKVRAGVIKLPAGEFTPADPATIRVAGNTPVIIAAPGAPAAANAAAAANGSVAPAAEPLPPPNKSIVVQLRRTWNPHPDFGGNDAADIYGLNHKTTNEKVPQSTVFTSGQPTKSVVFTYPLALPIDPAKYSTAVLRYRAKNINPTEHYTLRIDSGAGESRKIVRVGAGEEIKADGEIHELKHDLKADELTEPIRQICIALQCGPDAAPATLEVLEIRFDAADEKANDSGDDKPIQVIVTDADDKPVKDAIVFGDYERANFVRGASTDDKGAATVKVAKNESGKHSITVQKSGFVAVEVSDAANENGPLTVKLTPGQAYGGILTDNDHKPTPGVMVRARSKMRADDGQRVLTEFSTMTDEKGRWLTPELPSDASLVEFAKLELRDGNLAEAEIEADVAAKGVALVQKELTPVAGGREGAVRMALAAAANKAAADKAVPPPAPAPANAATPAANARIVAADEPLPAPEKAIVLDIHRPWLAGPMWEGNEPPKAYGENLDVPQPRFTVVDANAKCFWVYKPLWAIDLSRYPILKLKYRAKNTNAKDGYVLRLVQGDVLQVLKSDELVADGELHEYVKDLRELNAERKLTNIGIWVNAGEKGNATFDLAGLAFYAPDDAPIEALGKLSPQPFVIKGPDDKPIAGATVTVDAERANFAQSGTTDAEGKVSITPLTKWVNFHSVRVEKDGMYPIERKLPDLDQSPIEIQIVPGARYGGIARGSDNKLLAGAMIVATGNQDLDTQTQMPARSTVLADSQGRWVTPVLPAIDGMSISITPPGGGSAIDVDLARAKADGADLWAQLSKSMAVASNAPSKPESTPPPPAPEKTGEKEKAKGKDVPSASAANIEATILKVDESSVGGKINAMDGKQLVLKTDKETKPVPLADVQEITLKSSTNSNAGSGDSSKSGLANAQIELANNDHFKGAIKKWEEKKLSMTLAAAPGVTLDVPVEQARQLWIGTSDQIKKAQALNEKPGVEDVAFVAKDDQIIAVRGVSLGVDGESLKFRFNDQERKIAVNRLVGLTFGRSEDAPVDRVFRQAFQFANDDVITGNWTGVTKDTATATMIWGDEVKLPVKQIAKIRAANGRVVYLSDLKPTQVEQVPYFDRMLGFRIDKSLNGKPLQLSEGSIAKGIAVHSRTVLHYDLGGQFDEFRCKLGFQQPEGKLGQADIRVIGDGKAIFEKADAKGDQPSSDVNVKVAGVKELVLEVDFGKNQDVGDRVVWGNARLLRAQLPQTSAVPTP